MKKSHIPLILHQSWKNHQIPSHLLENTQSWEKIPGLEIRLSDNDETDQFISYYFPHYWQYVKNFKTRIERVDFWRYCTLYHYGGIYADLDMEYVGTPKQLYSLLQSPNVIIGSEPKEHLIAHKKPVILGNAIMFSPPGHKFWLYLMDWICMNYDPEKNPVENTGPMAMADLLQEKPYTYHDVIITPPKVFYPMTNKYTNKTLIKNGKKFPYISNNVDNLQDTLAIHKWEGSWIGIGTESVRQNLGWIILLIAILIIVILIFTRK